MTSSRPVVPGILLVAAAAALWALIGVFTTGLLELGMGAIAIAAWRALIGVACLGAHGALRGQLRLAGRGDGARLLLFGAVSVGLFYAALSRAVELGGVSLAWILLYTAPGWVAVAAVLVLREHVGRLRRVLVVVTMAGVVLVAVGGGEGVRVTAASLAWGLTAGWCYALWYIGGKQFLGRYAPVTISAWALLGGSLALLPFAGIPPASVRVWALLLGLGVVSTYLPALLYYTGLRTVEASRASIVATIEPVIALGLGAAFGAERLGALAVLGAVLVLAAAALASSSSAAAAE